VYFVVSIVRGKGFDRNMDDRNIMARDEAMKVRETVPFRAKSCHACSFAAKIALSELPRGSANRRQRRQNL
jgi:hypothetical protein